MAEITVQEFSVSSSLTPAFASASAGGDYFTNNGKVLLYIKNGSGAASRTVTIHSQINCDQSYEHDIEVVVPLSSEEMIGFFEIGRFNDVSEDVLITYDDEADLTIAAIRIN